MKNVLFLLFFVVQFAQAQRNLNNNINLYRPLAQTNVLSLDASKGFNNATWQDQSVKKNHVTLSASTTKNQDGVYFDGTNSATLAHPLPLGNFTIYMSVKIQELGKTLLGTGLGSEYGLHYQLNALYSATEQPFSFFNSDALKLNKTTIITLIRDVSKNDGNVFLYIDGIWVSAFPAKQVQTFNLTNLSGEMGFLFKGWMKNILIYNVAHEPATVNNVVVSLTEKTNYTLLLLQMPFTDRIKPYKVKKEGDNYIIDGDVIVSKRPLPLITIKPSNGVYMVGRSENLVESFKWRNAEIPVVIDPNIFSSGLKDAVYDALEELNDRTLMCFRPKTDNDEDYVRIKYDRSIAGSGRSGVGRDGGEQLLLLNGDANKGVVIHEALHAAGFYHEQSRNDRDNFVRILEDNILDDLDNNFDTEDDGITPYDYCSIMHYSRMLFSKNGKPTLECIGRGNTIPCPSCVDSVKILSPLDIQGIKAFYSEVHRFPCGTKWRPRDPRPQSSNYNVSANGYNYLSGDFNGDGKTDLAHIVNDGYLHVWLSDGNGGFTIKPPFPQRNGYSLAGKANFKFLTGDFNGDGSTDLVHIVNGDYLHVWLSKGDGTFDIKSRFPAQNGYVMNNNAGYHFTVGDFNGDGKSDLFHVVNGDYSRIWLSNGDGTFSVKERFPLQNGYDMVGGAKFKFLPGDFNGDGKTDMVHIVNGNYLHIWMSKGDGSFDVKSRFPAQNGYVLNNGTGYNFTVGDFNGDGKSDLFHIVNGDYSHTWLSKGDGTFDIKSRFPAQNGYNMENEAGYKFLTGDFNGDGKTDFIHIVNNNYSQTWLSKGDGSYDIKNRFPAQNGYSLNNDGGFRFIVGNFDGNRHADLIHLVTPKYTHTWLGNGIGAFSIGGQFFP